MINIIIAIQRDKDHTTRISILYTTNHDEHACLILTENNRVNILETTDNHLKNTLLTYQLQNNDIEYESESETRVIIRSQFLSEF